MSATESRIEELQGLPPLAPELLRSVVSSVGKRSATAPTKRVRVSDLAIELDRLDAYSRLCGFAISDQVPATWLHVLAFQLHMRLMSGRDAPFPLAGLVHVTNAITQYRPVSVQEQLTLTCEMAGVRRHRRGVLLDIACEGSVGEKRVWRDESAYLVRGADMPGLAAEPSAEVHDVPASVSVPLGQRWRLPADLGRQYARVSGDINPIHVSAASAKVFGFPRAVIHGMWTHARALSALQPRLPGAFEVRVRWTKPILLPATVRFGATSSGGATPSWQFGVFNRSGEKLQMAGILEPLA